MDIKDIAAEVKRTLKSEFPACKFSVSIERYSGGQSMTVALMSAPFTPFSSLLDCNGNAHKGEYAQLNHYQLRGQDADGQACNGYYLTPEARRVLARASEIANVKNWDHSDCQSDYFNVNYYLHIHIGKWNKPFCQAA